MSRAPAAGLLDRDDVVEDLAVLPGQERAPVDDHVDLGGAGPDRDRRCPPVAPRDWSARWGKPLPPKRFPTAAAGQCLDRDADHVRVDAQRGDMRRVRVVRVGPACLGGHRADLARRVRPLQRGQVDHGDRQVDRRQLRRLLDRPGRQARRHAARHRPHRPRADPCRNRRSEVSSAATSRRCGGNPGATAPSTGRCGVAVLMTAILGPLRHPHGGSFPARCRSGRRPNARLCRRCPRS